MSPETHMDDRTGIDTETRMETGALMSATVRRVLIVSLWVGALVAWVLYQRSSGLSTTDAAQNFVDTVRGAWWAFAAFVAVYAVRPIVLFPATLLTVAGGILFGPILGVLATVVGANLSALVAYGIARSLVNDGKAPEQEETQGLLKRWADRMRNDSFSTVMLMRLLFLPYDLVNYAAGFLRISPGPFILATALGSLPGTVSFTLAGASIERIDEGLSGLDLRTFGISITIFVVSIGIAQWLKRREVGALAR